ncbi:helix-turn-helix domain-containing protein [Streptomyces sp. NPDC056492]|uniref:helix-turn-helix domain-containing protein n=1 Tax=unclassified Streptomyces TaxID=2593676 RepID=UPI0036A41C3B
MSNRLAQHGQLSLLAIGTALHIQSLPEGAQVSIRALAERFPETEHRIGRALRELEAAGFLCRTRLRTVDGKVVTRTVSYNLPLADTPLAAAPLADAPPERDPEPEPESPNPEPGPPSADPEPAGSTPAPAPAPAHVPAPASGAEPPGDPVRDPGRAPAVLRLARELLAGLRTREPRLLLAERDVERLAPALVEWLDRGAAPEAVRRALTADVPYDLRNPAGLIAYRLRADIPPPLPPVDRAPAGPPPPDRPRYPLQTCDGCERAFRAPTPGGHCGECRAGKRKAA